MLLRVHACCVVRWGVCVSEVFLTSKAKRDLMRDKEQLCLLYPPVTLEGQAGLWAEAHYMGAWVKGLALEPEREILNLLRGVRLLRLKVLVHPCRCCFD